MDEASANKREGNSESLEAQRNDDRISKPQEESKSSGGWGGWGNFSALSVFSDLQKAAEEISRNVAEKAAKTFTDDDVAEQEPLSKENSAEEEDENATVRKSALDKLEQASPDTFLGQGLKALDHSVENLATGAWQAFGNAWKGGSTLIQKLETSAVNLAETFPSSAPSLLETGKHITTKGIQVLEYVGKETMDLLISETNTDPSKDLNEEVSFDRCFYIYGGAEQLEELEALSNHHALLFNRRKTKLSSEEKSTYESKLKSVQSILSLTNETNNSTDKGKNIEPIEETQELKSLHDSAVENVAKIVNGFPAAISGLSASDVITRTTSKIESLHSEGVHRISEMCCAAVAHLLAVGKLMIENGKKDEDDCEEKARAVRVRALLLSGYMEAVCNSFVTGVSEVSSACVSACDGDGRDGVDCVSEAVKRLSDLLRSDNETAFRKLVEGLRYLSFVVVSTSMPA